MVLFAHPYCPCTKATLNELEESLARLPSDASVSVVFVTCRLSAPEVTDSDNVVLARGLSGITVRFDEDGHEAQSLGATVSGELFAFDASGCLVYHGGLTPARGHQGDAVGQAQLELIAHGKLAKCCAAPIFGCPLSLPNAR